MQRERFGRMSMRPYNSTQLSDDQFSTIELTVTLNSRTDTARLSQSVCTSGMNCLDGRPPLVMTSIGNVRIIGQGWCEREDRLRWAELVLRGRQRLL